MKVRMIILMMSWSRHSKNVSLSEELQYSTKDCLRSALSFFLVYGRGIPFVTRSVSLEYHSLFNKAQSG